ncbi:hypothetical protein N0B31_05195 [Salinirubellus salinus]|uniref:Uncharacterized protein n=1 Tax=Salinirubellus salinus TaxID=1364945 RepID=A0A9E7U5R1_9EURY|nr:hypothetical protein [Salinirubellus salinus]UWM55680.1 hypothetical protein N0B31_05195 [Salinirubellus salinus]
MSTDEVAALLLDEYDSEVSLPKKALHKLLYFAKDELESERITVDIPTFWYMYGTMAATTGTDLHTGGELDDAEVHCDITVDDIDRPDGTVRRARRAVRRTLERYYDLGLEGLTDRMYDDAPYAVQRHYRSIDKQLETADSEQMTLSFDRNVGATRETVFEIVESFPTESFPTYEDDLHIWYRLMSTELDSSRYEPAQAKKYSKVFWRLFCLELAVRENDGLTRERIEQELNLTSIEDAKEQLRSQLRDWEREKAKANARDDQTTRRAADALVLPHVDFEVLG